MYFDLLRQINEINFQCFVTCVAEKMTLVCFFPRLKGGEVPIFKNFKLGNYLDYAGFKDSKNAQKTIFGQL